jgi:hypothetical protein
MTLTMSQQAARLALCSLNMNDSSSAPQIQYTLTAIPPHTNSPQFHKSEPLDSLVGNQPTNRSINQSRHDPVSISLGSSVSR